MTKYVPAVLILFAIAVSAAGQDIRGLEVCTAEKSMERRTGCLQSNVQFLQQAAVKQAREIQAKLDAASRDIAAQKAEIAALKAALAKLEHEVADLKRPKPDKK